MKKPMWKFTKLAGPGLHYGIPILKQNLPNHKLETVGRYLPGKSCKEKQMHCDLDDAKLAAMIWLEMEKI
jgi:hypothetical protein